MEQNKKEFEESATNDTWTIIGSASDKLMADHILDALRSDGFKAVLKNRSGYFGDLGLTLTSVFGSAEGAYEILTPTDQAEDASKIAEMIGGDSWESTNA
ncbi:MAG: hypothetical protein IIB00_08935 [candidate division Zixibacteria bacterium]|nr:hypothetical protein [candidate division Zixibacteria bacterium]